MTPIGIRVIPASASHRTDERVSLHAQADASVRLSGHAVRIGADDPGDRADLKKRGHAREFVDEVRHRSAPHSTKSGNATAFALTKHFAMREPADLLERLDDQQAVSVTDEGGIAFDADGNHRSVADEGAAGRCERLARRIAGCSAIPPIEVRLDYWVTVVFQTIRDQLGISGNIGPGICIVGVAVQDAPDLVRDHLQRLFLVRVERRPFGRQDHLFLEPLSDPRMAVKAAIARATLGKDVVDFGHSALPVCFGIEPRGDGAVSVSVDQQPGDAHGDQDGSRLDESGGHAALSSVGRYSARLYAEYPASSSRLAQPASAKADQCSSGILSRAIHDLTVWIETARATATGSAPPAALTMSV